MINYDREKITCVVSAENGRMFKALLPIFQEDLLEKNL